jgi:hypothetical protein
MSTVPTVMIFDDRDVRDDWNLEHWAAFRGSFDRLAVLLRRVAVGPYAPATISVLSAMCTTVTWHEPTSTNQQTDHPSTSWCARRCITTFRGMPVLMRAAWFGPLAAVVRRVMRRYGVPDPTLSWCLLSGPIFGNAVATLVFSDRKADLVIEKSGRNGQLEPVSRVALAGPE